MKTDKLLKLLLAVLLWAPVIFFSGLLIHNSFLYFSFDQTYGILPEKTEQINNPLWLASFYVHVLSGIVCLIIPPFSFIGVQLKKSVKFHRIIGQIYTWNMLAVLAPTGIYRLLCKGRNKFSGRIYITGHPCFHLHLVRI